MTLRRNGLLFALPIAIAGLGGGQAGAAPSACDAVSGNIVANCGFETTTSWSPFSSSDQSLSTLHTGTRGAFLNRSYAQTLATVAGQQYALSIWLSNGTSRSTSFSVSLATSSLSFTTPAPFGFSEYTGLFTATSSASLLTLTRTGGDYGYVDDVVLVARGAAPVPEPASAALLGAGLAGLAGLRRRRRRD